MSGSPTQSGLNNNGKSSGGNFKLYYIDTLPAASGKDLANSLIAVIDSDLSQISKWFKINSSNIGTPLSVTI